MAQKYLPFADVASDDVPLSRLLRLSLFQVTVGTLATGLGAGLFGHATLTAIIRQAPKDQIGLPLGAWGAVQATWAGIGVAFAGIVRDIFAELPANAGLSAAAPYKIVFMFEVAFLTVAVLMALPRNKGSFRAPAKRESNSLKVS